MYRKTQQLAEEFWKLWQAQYLTRIEKRSRWECSQHNLKVDDIVLLVNENEPRNMWKTGRIIAMHKGPDHKVRKCSVMVESSDLDNNGGQRNAKVVLERLIQKLVRIMIC